MTARSMKGLNRERTVFCGVLVLLISCAVMIGWIQSNPQCSLRSFYSTLFGSVPPEELLETAPLTVVPSPATCFWGDTPPPPLPFDMSRASPFMPQKEASGVESDWWREVAEITRKIARPFGPTVQVVNGQVEKAKFVRPSPLDGNAPVAYMGVVGASGQRLGMLRVKNGQFLNVREGEKLTDLGCTIIRIEKEAIHLMTRTGVYHILCRTGS